MKTGNKSPSLGRETNNRVRKNNVLADQSSR